MSKCEISYRKGNEPLDRNLKALEPEDSTLGCSPWSYEGSSRKGLYQKGPKKKSKRAYFLIFQ